MRLSSLMVSSIVRQLAVERTNYNGRMFPRMLLCCAALAGAAFGASTWPQFRGPGSTGVSEDAALPVTWSSTQNVAWKVDIPGLGWSSPVVAGDRIFVTSVISA